MEQIVHMPSKLVCCVEPFGNELCQGEVAATNGNKLVLHLYMLKEKETDFRKKNLQYFLPFSARAGNQSGR